MSRASPTKPAISMAIIAAKARIGDPVRSRRAPLTGPVTAAVAITTATSIEPNAASSKAAIVTSRIAVVVDSVATRAMREMPRKRVRTVRGFGWTGVLMGTSVL